MDSFDILVIGAGAAGIAAAKAAHVAGCKSIAIVDCEKSMGGILLQCSHRGFGINQSGQEYVCQLLSDFPENIVFYPETCVLSISEDKKALLSGNREIKFKELILSVGCREIAIGSLDIVGTRPRGIYTAGMMQKLMNLHGCSPDGPVVILGSGDIGLIMAKAISELGIQVSIVEKDAKCGGMARNRTFLKNGKVELICGCTVKEIYGEAQIEKVRLADGRILPCSTLLVAAGLIPDRELAAGLEDKDWLHLCGNCKSVHPMVEGVISEGIQAGLTAYERMRTRK